MTLNTFGGPIVVATTPHTHYYRLRLVPTLPVAAMVGQRISAAPGSSMATASSIIVLPTGAPVVRIQAFGGPPPGHASGAGRASGGGSGASGGGPGSAPSSGVPNSGPATAPGGSSSAGIVGRVTATALGTLTVRAASGAMQTLKVTSATERYALVPMTAGHLTKDSLVTAKTSTASGHNVAIVVVDAGVVGPMMSIDG